MITREKFFILAINQHIYELNVKEVNNQWRNTAVQIAAWKQMILPVENVVPH